MIWNPKLDFVTKKRKVFVLRKGSLMYFDNMVLYYKPTCPFCHKVLAFMEQEDIAMPMRDTLEPGMAISSCSIKASTLWQKGQVGL